MKTDWNWTIVFDTLNVELAANLVDIEIIKAVRTLKARIIADLDLSDMSFSLGIAKFASEMLETINHYRRIDPNIAITLRLWSVTNVEPLNFELDPKIIKLLSDQDIYLTFSVYPEVILNKESTVNELPIDPPRAIMQILKLDIDQFNKQDMLEIFHFIFYSESGLAYDGLIYLINHAGYTPSKDALALIKLTANMLGVEYPNLSC
jgi:hypothetical protein